MPTFEAKYPVSAGIVNRDGRKTKDIRYVRFARSVHVHVPEVPIAAVAVVATMDKRSGDVRRLNFPVLHHGGEFYTAATMGLSLEKSRHLMKPRDWNWLVAAGADVSYNWRQSFAVEDKSPIADHEPEVPPTHRLQVWEGQDEKGDFIQKCCKNLIVVDGFLFEKAEEPVVIFSVDHPDDGFSICFGSHHRDLSPTARFRLDQKEFALRYLKENFGYENLKWPPISVKRPDLLSLPVEAESVVSNLYALLESLRCLHYDVAEIGLLDQWRRLPRVDFSGVMKDPFMDLARAAFPESDLSPDSDGVEAVIEAIEGYLADYRPFLEAVGGRKATVVPACEASISRWRMLANDYDFVDAIAAGFAP